MTSLTIHVAIISTNQTDKVSRHFFQFLEMKINLMRPPCIKSFDESDEWQCKFSCVTLTTTNYGRMVTII